MSLRHRQTKTRTRNILIDLDETLKDTLLVFLGNTLTRITDIDTYMIALHQVEAQCDGAFLRELDGILHEMIHNF